MYMYIHATCDKVVSMHPLLFLTWGKGQGGGGVDGRFPLFQKYSKVYRLHNRLLFRGTGTNMSEVEPCNWSNATMCRLVRL